MADGRDNLVMWKKGQSGNPKGPPKGNVHLSTHIRRLLHDPDFTVKLMNGEEYTGLPIIAIIKVAVIKAINGDKDAREWLAKYGWGTKIDVTSNGDPIKPIIVIKSYDDDDSENKTKQLADKSNRR